MNTLSITLNRYEVKVWLTLPIYDKRLYSIIMYLHKTTDVTGGKTATESPVRNAAAKSPPPQATKSSAPQAPASHAAAPSRSTSALAAAAGLPSDKLSASIISFARFFSLPLKPELMAAMRRQTLAAPPSAAPPAAAEASAAAKSREALSLAAAAAESKGVELYPKGLAAFAEAIDPDWQKRENSGGDRRGRQNKDRHQQEEENAAGKTGPITANGLKQMALEAAEKDPLLALLNRLPGKNGRRWVVLPFSFDEGGKEFRVSLRILLEEDQSPSTSRAVCMALDIDENERQWLFALEAANNHTDSPVVDRLSANRLSVYLQPHLPPTAHAPLARELSELLGIPLARISVKNRAEAFPCESGRTDDLLRSINEAV